MTNQKEATYQAVVNVTGFNGEGQCNPTSEQVKQITAILVEGFKASNIALSKQFDEAGLKKYTSGLISNWLRKDSRLNGNVKYTAKNPGSRTSSSDPTLKELTKLYSTLTTEEEKAEVQTYIDVRKAELNQPKQIAIDYSKLPADLQAKFNK